jgi:hypothetical protein
LQLVNGKEHRMYHYVSHLTHILRWSIFVETTMDLYNI